MWGDKLLFCISMRSLLIHTFCINITTTGAITHSIHNRINNNSRQIQNGTLKILAKKKREAICTIWSFELKNRFTILCLKQSLPKLAAGPACTARRRSSRGTADRPCGCPCPWSRSGSCCPDQPGRPCSTCWPFRCTVRAPSRTRASGRWPWCWSHCWPTGPCRWSGKKKPSKFSKKLLNFNRKKTHLCIHKVQSGVVHGQQAALAQLEHTGAGQGVPVGLVGRVPQPARVIGGAVFVDVRVVLDQVQGRHARGWSGFAHQATNSLNWGLTGFLRKRRNLNTKWITI